MTKEPRRTALPTAAGACLCGAVRFEITVPPVWAWHDHSAASRHAQGAFCVTYVGTWRSRLTVTAGEGGVTTYAAPGGATRSFCAACGTPLFYVRPHAPKMVNIPRALFAGRVGREPRYHVALGEAPDWAWRGGKLVPLKNYPGVMWERLQGRARRPAGFWPPNFWPPGSWPPDEEPESEGQPS